MANACYSILSIRFLCYTIFILCVSFISAFYWCHYCSGPCYSHYQMRELSQSQPIDILRFPSAWNQLNFSSDPTPKLLKIALFINKWPDPSHAGGLERHALTLHLALAKRGHEIHIFTTSSNSFPRYPVSNFYFHLSKPTTAGYLDQASVWTQFQTLNATGRPFDGSTLRVLDTGIHDRAM